MARILIVDDEPSIVHALQLALEEIACESAEASDAEAALKLLAEQSFDLLILDKNLPGRTGVELARMVRFLNTGVPIVLITAFGSTESARETLNLRVDAYLEKPFPDIYKVSELVARFLAAGRRRWIADAGILTADSGSARITSVAGETAGPVKVLVASSDPIIHERIREILSPLGAELDGRVDPEKAGGRAEELAPGLIFLDAPSGPEKLLSLVGALRARAADSTVCVLTAEILPLETLKKLIALGVAGLIDRGFDERSVRRVRELLRDARLQ